MFDSYARSLLVDVPELEGLTGDAIARALSRAYLALLHFRTNREEATQDVIETQAFLRRLANALTFQVILVPERPLQERRAAAFAAGEAIALVSDFLALANVQEERKSAVFLAERFARVEAALLYLFSQYDACAAGVLTLPYPILETTGRIDEAAAVWCVSRIEDLCRLKIAQETVQVRPLTFEAASELGPRELAQDTIGRLYAELGDAVVDFSVWLSGGENGLESAITRIEALLAALSPARNSISLGHVGHDYARIYHLSTLLSMLFPELSTRALCHVVPSPPGMDHAVYRQYLSDRAKGSEKASGRPLLWPSAAEYVSECIVGNARHAIVSMPTGSGKSFVGELAVSQSLNSGWVLYLAPTNALAEQIRGDLRVGLETLGTEILAFIGDQEYSIFATDAVTQMNANSVAVMTPEKCSLAMRLSPDAFSSCSLVVFDECHLIGDSGSTRGPTAELVLTQLMLRAPQCRFLLMSAIIQNPEDLAGWIQNATGQTARPVSIRWRPTRTLRSILGVENESFQAAADTAKAYLASLGESRTGHKFTARCALAACLQGAWQSVEEPDYGTVSLNCDAQLSVKREKRQAKWHYTFNADSWVNATAVNLSVLLASKQIQTLVFTPASKHYPFSNAGRIELEPSLIAQLPPQPQLNEVCQILAEFELGTTSDVFTLLEHGVAVHTSLMLEVEKIGSEAAFRHRCVPIMFATGTLAQGLNLPAIAVIIAGTRIGDPRGDDDDVVEQRKFSQLLNAAGRAGRAGFANQGVVITIPDKPVAFRDFDSVLAARQQADFLQQSDNAVIVRSGLEDFLDNVCKEVLRSDQANDVELQVISLLAGGDTNQLDAGSVLRRTYAAYLRRQANLDDATSENVQRLVDVRDTFLAETKSPEWLTVAAQRAGLDFFLTLGIFRAWGKVRKAFPDDLSTWGVMEWLNEFLAVVKHIPPGLMLRHLPSARLARVSDAFKALEKKQSALFLQRDLDWTVPDDWQNAWDTVRLPLESWMHGESIADIAAILTNQTVDQIPSTRTQGKPLPRALSVVMETWSSLSLIAGGFLAVAEQVFEEEVPLSLACLPMSIKYGCDTPGALAWFRFGVRLRRASRVLAEAFPPPLDIETDEDLKSWVRNTRREWLNGDSDAAVDSDLNDILIAVREFITA
jgi:superfamily II DNA/RNA helicase